MNIKQPPTFPNSEWSWFIKKDQVAKIVHPSGVAFVSSVKLSKDERLNGKEERSWPLNPKDVHFTAYVLDYLLNKSPVRNMTVNDAMIKVANMMCSYRFTVPFKDETKFEKIDGVYRKLGEHKVRISGVDHEVFVIGHHSGTLIAVMTDLKSPLSLFQLIELPREYFELFSL